MLETSVVKASISNNPKKSPVIEAVTSFFIPGTGQVYSREVRKGLGFFLNVAMFAIFDIFLIRNNDKGTEFGPVLVVSIAIILFWIFNIYDAYAIAKKKRGENS